MQNPLFMIEQTLDQTYEGMYLVLKYVNKYNQILYDIIIPKLFNYFYEIEDKIITEEEEVELVKPPAGGFYPRHVKKELLVAKDEQSIHAFAQKSFHLDKYCFDQSEQVE